MNAHLSPAAPGPRANSSAASSTSSRGCPPSPLRSRRSRCSTSKSDSGETRAPRRLNGVAGFVATAVALTSGSRSIDAVARLANGMSCSTASSRPTRSSTAASRLRYCPSLGRELLGRSRQHPAPGRPHAASPARRRWRARFPGRAPTQARTARRLNPMRGPGPSHHRHLCRHRRRLSRVDAAPCAPVFAR